MTTSTKDSRLEKAQKPAEDAMRLHPYYRGKMQTAPKCAVRDIGRLRHLVHARRRRALQGHPGQPGAGLRDDQQGQHDRRGL